MPINFNLDFEKTSQWLSERWERKSTIALILVCLFFVLILFFSEANLSGLTIVEIVIIFALLLIVYLLWHHTIAIPKASRKRIGFAVAIACEDKVEKKAVRADFIAALRRLLARGHDVFKFQLIEIPDYHARKITNADDALRVRQRAKSHFIIYGTAKIRKLGDSEKHVLNLDAQVALRPVPDQIKQNLSREMSEVFPRRLHIDTKNDLLSFEFTSDWVDCVARYIVGVAASISGDLQYSETLFNDLLAHPHLKQSPLPPLKKMRQRVPIRLGEIYAFKASTEYEKWRKDRNPKHMDDMWMHLTKLRNVYPENYAGRLLTSIYYFCAQRNIDAAIREVRKCRDIRDATWRYSYAFLLAYRGEMLKARRMYKAAFQHYYEREDVPIQTEEFMQWVLDEEPDKIQLHFCLGLVNWRAKQDKQRAILDFKNFIEAEGANKFSEELRLAQAYVATLEGELRKEDEIQDKEKSINLYP